MNPPNYLQRQRLDDLYVAELTSLEDPLRLGRVQVRVFGFSDELPEESLPWAEWHLPLGAGINRGTVPVMKVGDRVQVRFAQGDGRYPVVVGSALTATSREVQLPAIGIDGNAVDDRRGARLIAFGSSRYLAHVTVLAGFTLSKGRRIPILIPDDLQLDA